jgi:hypothetical protein
MNQCWASRMYCPHALLCSLPGLGSLTVLCIRVMQFFNRQPL